MQKNNSKSGGKNKNTRFEISLNKLGNIVTRLESSELPLEEYALSKFERGVQLARKSQKKIQQAEQRVHMLLNDIAKDAPLVPFTPDFE
ncbi:MAG: exodeoxyribonuclease VII small subunit [Serratia symbiotica]|nr:exodeoxyribonuclease VII small subunit [Serratia symbiotica]